MISLSRELLPLMEGASPDPRRERDFDRDFFKDQDTHSYCAFKEALHTLRVLGEEHIHAKGGDILPYLVYAES